MRFHRGLHQVLIRSGAEDSPSGSMTALAQVHGAGRVGAPDLLHHSII
jgi:hypothetical protein